MFVDASALCAVLLKEPDRDLIQAKIKAANDPMVSPVVVWETTRALVRALELQPDEAYAQVRAYLDLNRFSTVMIGSLEESEAITAFTRFGKTRHPADLNMGDCFAYACTRTHETRLLFKGNDFSQTDIAKA